MKKKILMVVVILQISISLLGLNEKIIFLHLEINEE
jgi:hypothetical protein